MSQSDERRREAFDELFSRDNETHNSGMDRIQPVRFKQARRGLTVSVLVLLLLALAVFVISRISAPLSTIVEREMISTSLVKTVRFEAVFEVSGQLESERNYAVTSDQSGKVSAILAENGQQILSGETMAILENSEVALQLGRADVAVANARSAIQDLKVKIEQSRLDHERTVLRLQDEIETLVQQGKGRRILAQEGFVSENDIRVIDMNLNRKRKIESLEKSAFEALDGLYSTQLGSAQLVLQRAREERDLLADALMSLTITAPLSGQLSGFDLSFGQRLAAGDEIAQIRDVNAPIIRAYVDEYYLSSLRTGQNAEILLAGERFQAFMSRIEADIVQGQFLAEWKFTDPDMAERKARELGQSVRVRHTTGDSQSVLAIDLGDYLNTRDGEYVFVMEGDRARRQEVELGRRNERYVEVLSGLKSGDMIVTSTYEPFLDFEAFKVR